MQPSARISPRSIILASSVGTLIEWYDFFLYGTAAALVFNKLFFPTLDPLAGILAAYLTYAVGFLARPLGGILFAQYGDRLGRKKALVRTLLMMGAATCLIGLLPTYSAIGRFAPVGLVLLRFVQGLGVGGEWGAAVLMTVEHAPRGKRGLYGSFAQLGVPLGFVVAVGVFRLVSALPQEQFMSWGWRIPFLASALLVVAGLVIRSKVPETPVFQLSSAATAVSGWPLRRVWRVKPIRS